MIVEHGRLAREKWPHSIQSFKQSNIQTMEQDIFDRTELLLGKEVMKRLQDTRVIIFGIGGVGSWCAESLVRSGIGHLTIVDNDNVSVSNINRQAMATTETVGMPKVEVMKKRLLSINPDADIIALQELYCTQTAEQFHLENVEHGRLARDVAELEHGRLARDVAGYDYVVDAIDSLSNKMELILHATRAVGKGRFFSSMGAALKMDPSQIKVTEFWDVDGCPLARALRKRMKKLGRYPAAKFRCVWSPEMPHPSNQAIERLHGRAACTPHSSNQAIKQSDNQKGSLVHITAIFGFTLAGEIIKSVNSE